MMSSGKTTPEVRLQYLDAMGVALWVRRDSRDTGGQVAEPVAEPVERTAVEAVIPEPAPGAADAPVSTLDWAALESRVASCTDCGLHAGRTRTVFGVGNRDADWMIVGEAPGADEDRQGEPFVGRAGQLLNVMLLALGLAREKVYIANILKCRPPNNRDPEPDEVGCCEPFLRRQVELVRPRMILAVGRVAAQNLLKTETRVGQLRGRRFEYADTGIPLVVTYHPAYLLRSPKEKRKAWQDLCFARQVLEGDSTDTGG